MLKVYLLRERIREDVEFNFYNAERAEIEFQGIQHYEAKSVFGGYSGLRKQQYNDMKKPGIYILKVSNEKS